MSLGNRAIAPSFNCHSREDGNPSPNHSSMLEPKLTNPAHFLGIAYVVCKLFSSKKHLRAKKGEKNKEKDRAGSS